jgi:hypothetical protein
VPGFDAKYKQLVKEIDAPCTCHGSSIGHSGRGPGGARAGRGASSALNGDHASDHHDSMILHFCGHSIAIFVTSRGRE